MARNKIILLLLAVIFIAAPSDAKSSKESPAAKAVAVKWHDSYKAAAEMSKYQNKPVFIDFTAEWCQWCDKLDKEVFSYPGIAEKLQKFICVRIDVNKDRRTAYGFSVTSLPRFIVINTHSEIVGDWLGYRSREDFSKLLDEVMEYTRTKTGTMTVPEIPTDDVKQTTPAKTVMVDFSTIDAVIDQMANKNPAVRAAVIEKLLNDPARAMEIAAAGLKSKYLGTRIASWQLMKKMNRTEMNFDPWASTKQRNELLRRLKLPGKPPEKPAKN